MKKVRVLIVGKTKAHAEGYKFLYSEDEVTCISYSEATELNAKQVAEHHLVLLGDQAEASCSVMADFLEETGFYLYEQTVLACYAYFNSNFIFM